MLMTFVSIFIFVFAVANLVRLVSFLVGTEIHRARTRKNRGGDHTDYRPSVSLLVPVHNEGIVVERTLASLLAVDYTPLQIIVADDGSTDDTAERIVRWKMAHDPDGRIEAFTKPNGGKADTLNVAREHRATGELIMCLDGDSTIAPDAVTKSVAYFADPRVEATASNVVIIPDGTLLGFVQRFEYAVAHNMKRCQTQFNWEYIIGGIGSTFRKDTLDAVGGYPTNTVTEDIDLTLKIIEYKGNRDSRVIFAADSLVYTEAVPSWTSLVAQRTRWKFGRTQSFFKHPGLFFARDHQRYSRGLTWFTLPMVLVQETVGLLEPVMLAALLAIVVLFHSPGTLVGAVAVMAVWGSANILGSTNLSWKTRVLMVLASPLMWGGFYLITCVEYISLIKTVSRLPRLRQSVSAERVTWKSPERVGTAAV